MYFFIVAALMVALPFASILLDMVLPSQPAPFMMLLGKWYVTWAVGVRLGLADIRQILQPRYTAETLLGIKDPAAHLVVRELGFANFSFGVLGMVSLFVPAWTIPAAIVGSLFYGLAGINHTLQPHRNKLENVAMLSDLFAALVLAIYWIWAIGR
ncbi:MAG: hypothetical protein QM703_27795 [Gemmatales bacterium]